MSTYSFLDVHATINGPGGQIRIGSGAAVSEEGITVTMDDDKNSKVIGADGEGMHSLHAGKAGKVTVRLLKTSPTNAKLQQMYSLQTSSSALHGRNTITVTDVARGDLVVARECAFVKFPDLGYAKDGAMQEWVFDAIKVDQKLGAGLNLGL